MCSYCMDHDVHCLGLSCYEGDNIPTMSTSIGSVSGGAVDYGGFSFKPAELTPALCSDLYDNLVGKFKMISFS